ncbi:hypothetical protein ASPZODRAFT_142331 [Penicilliopsis zonata CBS 506.65]|uniref:MARVEL domain-containing protein n=1 Tax=Penicilliopsis zonata CBS 506.65 TaxID=1073090 RepID=A0A1L9SHC1_9EURO|nr:hypothetical protein ASPZODRAFT_142331 [Penicilliopsis zonata CBS 506.65]OJJ46517.1 hypothetical protein ASPZODRAFT_142331 [Penicilliopsis zonata CBS 506.65]
MSEKRSTNISELGFGYVADNDPLQRTPQSALRVPGTPGWALDLQSPTAREEYLLDKHEKASERQNAKDLRVKTRVRLAKAFLRVVNFSCSLIILSLLSTTLVIFNATKTLPERNNLPPWALGTNPWAQYLLIGLSCVSLLTCLVVFWGYWKGGHKRAKKLAIYYSVFSVCYFVFNLVMWVVAAAIFQNSKNTGNGEDLWGWSCKTNERYDLFEKEINYNLVCRLQNWGLVCAIIEVVIELFVILIYAVVFYRFYSKRRLMKTMDTRDRARSDLYLAQLRLQSAPNTPGFRMATTPKSPFFHQDFYGGAPAGDNAHVQYATPQNPSKSPPAFHLQPPPIRIQGATPVVAQEGFPSQKEPVKEATEPSSGKETYESVAVPGMYTTP